MFDFLFNHCLGHLPIVSITHGRKQLIGQSSFEQTSFFAFDKTLELSSVVKNQFLLSLILLEDILYPPYFVDDEKEKQSLERVRSDLAEMRLVGDNRKRKGEV